MLLGRKVGENFDFTDRGGAKCENGYSITVLSNSQPYNQSH